jgi:hypothetical protein
VKEGVVVEEEEGLKALEVKEEEVVVGKENPLEKVEGFVGVKVKIELLRSSGEGVDKGGKTNFDSSWEGMEKEAADLLTFSGEAVNVGVTNFGESLVIVLLSGIGLSRILAWESFSFFFFKVRSSSFAVRLAIFLE